MRMDDLDSFEETLDVLSSPTLTKQIGESFDQIQSDSAEVLSKEEARSLVRPE